MAEASGFFWIEDLVKLLVEYESKREQYPTFEDFFPKVVEFFENYQYPENTQPSQSAD